MEEPSREPVSLTEAEETLISEYRKSLDVFKKTHHYVEEDASETQQLSYISRHRGGVVFPGTHGLSIAQLDAYTHQALSALRAMPFKVRVEKSV